MKANINEGWFVGEHAANLLVKMMPSESEIYADLVLTLNEEEFAANKHEIVKLDRGDRLEFNATLMAVGDEETIHHLHAFHIRRLEGKIEIPSDMRNRNRNSVVPRGVEIVSIVDVPVHVDHDHVHFYNDTFNQTSD